MTATSHALPGLVLTDRRFELPLDYANPGRTISVFVREVVAPGKEKEDLPCVVFFQGGPGSGSPRPTGNTGWIKRMSQDYRVLLLDQRGTGISTPVTAQSLRGLAPKEQAAYLRHFRADNIVRDAEAIRKELIGADKWTILGQSYGGFCALRYLSESPEGLEAALITGGIPSPLTRGPDDVYRATYPRVIEKNRRYYERYPGDVERVREIARHLATNDVRMPSGGRLTVERFQQLGLQFGMSDGFEAIHYLLEEAFIDVAGGGREVNWNFLVHLEQLQSFDTGPIFSVLHEACYTQGEASRWSAQRLRAEFPQLDPGAKDVLFTGEMIYPWMFDTYPQLVPLKEAAEILAQDDSWPRLYDVERLKANRVPVAAAVYYDDMYVHREFSEETARIVPNMKLWITNQYEHNGLRADGEAVVDRLLKMVRGEL